MMMLHALFHACSLLHRKIRMVSRRPGRAVFLLGVLSFFSMVSLFPYAEWTSNTPASHNPSGTGENQLVINEIMYEPLAGTPEWVELYNRGAADVDLVNWRIKDRAQETGAAVSDRSSVIEPGKFVVLTGDSAELASTYPSPFFILPVDGFPRLNNDSDEISLVDPSGGTVEIVSYDKSWGNNPGVSLERICIFSPGNSKTNWGLSTAPHGATPGAENSLKSTGVHTAVSVTPEPNPFSPTRRSEECTILVSQPFDRSYVTLKIYDRYGRLVRELLRGEPRGRVFRETWDGRNGRGRLMQTGIYIIYFNAHSASTGERREFKTTVVLVN